MNMSRYVPRKTLLETGNSDWLVQQKRYGHKRRQIYSHAHRRVQQGTLGNFFFLGDFKHNFDAENDGAGRFLKKRPESGFLGPGGQVGVKKGVKISLPRKTANWKLKIGVTT